MSSRDLDSVTAGSASTDVAPPGGVLGPRFRWTSIGMCLLIMLAVIVIASFGAWTGQEAAQITNSVLRWLHLFFGIVWIGLLYYLNFVQVPTMPKVPAELKKGVTGYIAPTVMFFFRYGALLTVLTGLAIDPA